MRLVFIVDLFMLGSVSVCHVGVPVTYCAYCTYPDDIQNGSNCIPRKHFFRRFLALCNPPERPPPCPLVHPFVLTLNSAALWASDDSRHPHSRRGHVDCPRYRQGGAGSDVNSKSLVSVFMYSKNRPIVVYVRRCRHRRESY